MRWQHGRYTKSLWKTFRLKSRQRVLLVVAEQKVAAAWIVAVVVVHVLSASEIALRPRAASVSAARPHRRRARVCPSARNLWLACGRGAAAEQLHAASRVRLLDVRGVGLRVNLSD